MTTTNSTALATRPAGGVARSEKADVRDLLTKYKSEIASALPKHLTPDRMLRVALTAINSTPSLLSCRRETLVACVLQMSSLGLEPGLLGHAYLIPYKDACTLQIGYKGYLELARRSGQVLTISANNVYANEKFLRTEGIERNLEHVPLPPSQRGDYIGTYAVAKLRDGSFHFEWLWAEEVDKIRRSSRASGSGPWVDHTDEMRRKTAIRRLIKYLPISVELARAQALDEAHEQGLPGAADVDVTDFKVDDEPNAKMASTVTIEAAMKRKADEAEKAAIEAPKAEPAAEPVIPFTGVVIGKEASTDPADLATPQARAITVIRGRKMTGGQVRALAAKVLGSPMLSDPSTWTDNQAQVVLEALAAEKA